MTRLSLLGKSLAPTRILISLSDVSRVIIDKLSVVVEGAISIWLIHGGEHDPLILAEGGDPSIPQVPPEFVYERGMRPDGLAKVIKTSAAKTEAIPGNLLLSTTSLALSVTDAIVVALCVEDRPHTERSHMFLEGLLDTCTSAVHQWLIQSELRSSAPGDAFALVEAELVARELSHIAKNRLTTIQNIVFLLRAWSSESSERGYPTGYLDQLEAEVEETAAQLLHAQGGLSQRNVLVVDAIRGAVNRAIPSMRESVEIVVDPQTLRLSGPSFNFDTVVSNLLRNAVDALVSSGVAVPKILIRASEGSVGESRVCMVEVHDNGPGVDSEIIPGVFGGVSTKGPGHSGQGLQNVLRAVSTVGGRVSLPERSPTLGGALFKVEYPLDASEGSDEE